MKTFLESSATKVLLIAIAGQFLKDIAPMLQAHSINLWALAEGQVLLLAILLGNAMRPDVVTGIKMLDLANPPKDQRP